MIFFVSQVTLMPKSTNATIPSAHALRASFREDLPKTIPSLARLLLALVVSN